MYSLKKLSILLLFTLVLLNPNFSKAELIRVNGMASLTYADSANAKIKSQALKNAKLVAFKKYMSRQTASRKSVYAKLESVFRSSLDTIIIEESIQREKDDSEAKKYSVLVSVGIDATEVDRIFNDASRANKLEGEFMTFFVARVATGQNHKKFDEKRVKISESSSAEKHRETAVSTGSGSVEAIEKEKFSRNATGGSRESKLRRAVITYEPSIDISLDIGPAIEEVLIDNGFDPVPYDELDEVPTLEELVEEGAFSKTGKLSKKYEKKFRKAAREGEVNYFGIGDIEIGVPANDPVRGGLKLTAYVNFTVYDLLCCKRAKKIASVKKKSITETGTDQRVMEMKAANKAAVFAMETVMGQLKLKAMEGR